LDQAWPSFELLEQQLNSWSRQHPQIMTLEPLGRSAQGRALYAAYLTDPEGDDAHKQHVLLTAQHSGIERSATGSMFALMQWLLSGEPQAREILRRQTVVCMPLVNPDGYVHGTHATTAGHDPYIYWTLSGPRDPSTMPESVAVKQMMDRYQPEVHADLHGLDESFPGYMSVENSAFSYSNCSLRPYHYEIANLMDEAALREGFPSDRLEQDGERLLWGPQLEEISHKLWSGRPRAYAATYCYNRYHSLILASECMWPRSGMVRHRRLLQLGNERWPGEQYSGYPTRVVMVTTLRQLVAYGVTAAQRRASRVELWNKQGQVLHGMVNPQRDGAMTYVCATRHAAAREWLSDTSLRGFLAELRRHPGMDVGPIAKVFDGLPTGAGQWGSEPNLFLTGGDETAGGDEPIRHGLALRVRVPYPKARLTEVLLNGRPLAISETDGYCAWQARGFIHVQVNVPPERSRTEDLFVMTVRYDPGEKRVQGWRPLTG